MPRLLEGLDLLVVRGHAGHITSCYETAAHNPSSTGVEVDIQAGSEADDKELA